MTGGSASLHFVSVEVITLGLKVKHKYPLIYTPLFNVDVTFVSKLSSLLHNKIKNKHLLYVQKEFAKGLLV